MTSRQAQKLFFALSVDALPPEVAEQVRQRIAECPQCRSEWVLVEQTLVTLSTTSQPVLSSHVSRQLWVECERNIKQSSCKTSQAALPASHRPRSEVRTPSFFSFLSRPAWGWTALGTAAAVFAAAWLLPTSPAPQTSVVTDNARPTASAEWIALAPVPGDAPPSHAATSLIEHHAAMDVAPLDDPVGATLVSYSAQPAP